MVVNAKKTNPILTMYFPIVAIGKPISKAADVSPAPSIVAPTSNTPVLPLVNTITSPVIVQISIVSKNVPVIEIKPCLAGKFVFAAAAAIGALPSPDSFENTPLAIPFLSATETVTPAIAPPTALGLKALVIIKPKACGIALKLHASTITAPIIYATAINGTIASDTFDILLIPPNVTKATNAVMTTAVAILGILKFCAAAAIELT